MANPTDTPDFRLLFESAPGLYLVLTPDEEHRIVTACDAYLRGTLTKRDEIIGRKLFEVFPDNPDDPNATGEMNLRASLSRVVARGERDVMPIQKYDIRRPPEAGGGFEERFWSPTNTPVLVDGTVVYIIHRVEDVTEAERLRVRQATMLKRAERLEHSNRELEDFAAVASHDLQEPLRKIQSFGDRLKTRTAGLLDLESASDLERMRVAAGRMQSLIRDLLAFSRIVSRGAGFEPILLATSVQEALDDLEVRLRETGCPVEVGALPSIEADPRQMRQLFLNLIGNAVKFRRPDVPPIVRVTAELIREDGEDRCRIAVTDNGIGFDDKYLPRLFTIFQRLHSPTAYEGTGVGLAICRRIAERHRGTITAHGIPDEGSTFLVTLPIWQEAPPSRGDAIGTDASGGDASREAQS
jgi:signal transduction histidine kinase